MQSMYIGSLVTQTSLSFQKGEKELSTGNRMGRTTEERCPMFNRIWGCSSAGRAPALQAGGHRFDPAYLHHEKQQLFNNGLRNNEPNQYGLIAQPVRAHA